MSSLNFFAKEIRSKRTAGGVLAQVSRCNEVPITTESKKEAAVDEKAKRTKLNRATPELPVEDVERAQQHYRDVLGFEIGWLYPGGGIGAVSRDEMVIFFRRRERPFEPAIHWVFAAEIDATYEELRARGARIVEPLEKKPWGLRQFTMEDLDGNVFYFHCD